ncbi:hypothetical protein [Gloeocapsopsis crepidinum]|uniref:hypothetical protein n=1 Tax=Gloeocapsopsis crepidinum TaxID=693223 RepID=UPI003F71FEBC
MKIIKLPAILPGDLDLAIVNQQLRSRTAQLDWSAVISAPEQYLAVLLAGLDLDDDAEVLDCETSTLSDTIAQKVAQVLLSSGQPHIESKPTVNAIAPALWQQPNSIPQQDNVAVPSVFEVEHNNEPILQPPSYYQIRAELEQAVLADLLGPAGGEYEEIDEARVSDRYLVGLIAPLHRRQRLEQSDDDALQTEELTTDQTGSVDLSIEQLDELAVNGVGTSDDGTTEPTNPTAETMFPSSMGMSFCVSGTATAMRITAGWGQYKRIESEYLKNAAGKAKQIWRRHPIVGQSPAISLTAGKIAPWRIDPEHEVYVRGQIRACGDDWIVSLFLVNEQREPQRSRDQAWLFQPELSVESATNQKDIFIRRVQVRSPGKCDPGQYAEEQLMEMLYRRHVEFAIGHGIGVHAEVAAGRTDRAVRLCTRVVPAYEVPKTDAPTFDEAGTELVLDMKELANSTAAELLAKLNPLVRAYADWIAIQKNRVAQLHEYADTANDALANCARAKARIQSGLDLLQADAKALAAFQFMNQAMWQQRVHSLYAEQKRRGEDVEISIIDVAQNRSWRPFQVAFILLNLPSITDLAHPDRCHETAAIADLLWFPTGGGKTEAYLGLTAYTIGLRRLQGAIAGRSGESGVAVLMRYTLRLLTLQQFQRATALICACEAIRREHPTKWGNEPFRISLWVGQKTTPNRTEQSEEFLKQKLGQYQSTSSGSPHQVWTYW